MKAYAFLLALLLLLSGCTVGNDGDTPSPGGVVQVSPTPLPTASPGEPSWWEGITLAELPTEITPFGTIAASEALVCLALFSQAEVGLYASPDPTAGLLLRKGTTLQFFPQIYSTQRYNSPEASWGDVDGDGEEELSVKYLVKDTDGAIVYELHIYEWDGASWSDHAFDQKYFQPLLEEMLTYQYQDGVVTLALGSSSCEIWYDGDKEPTGLAPVGELVFFRQEEGGYVVIFGLRLTLPDGGNYDAATLSADLIYADDGFSLQNYKLEPVGGV